LALSTQDTQNKIFFSKMITTMTNYNYSMHA